MLIGIVTIALSIDLLLSTIIRYDFSAVTFSDSTNEKAGITLNPKQLHVE